MRNSSGTVFGRSGGNVTVIDQRVRRSSARNAKIAGCVTWVIVTLLAAMVLASRWHPILALLAGALIGLVVAFVVAVVVLIWPVLRVIWWWLPEIGLAAGLVAGWVWLADRLSFWLLLGVIMLIAGVPAAIPVSRRRLVAVGWCLVVRHRIRTCFAEFIIYNRTGSLPLILWCVPTPAGVRLWIWLRPGLSLEAVQDRAEQIAVACWAATAVASAASDTNAAFVRLDIKRRDALTRAVTSPLMGRILPGVSAAVGPDSSQVPTALDLPDVSPADVEAPGKHDGRRDGRKAPAVVPVITDPAEDDISDWL